MTRPALRSALAARLVRLAAAVTLGAALLTGCGPDGAQTSCSAGACTITFDVGQKASTTILGVDAKLVGVNGDTVVLEVAGQQITLTKGESPKTVAGFQISLDSVTDSKAVIRITRT